MLGSTRPIHLHQFRHHPALLQPLHFQRQHQHSQRHNRRNRLKFVRRLLGQIARQIANRRTTRLPLLPGIRRSSRSVPASVCNQQAPLHQTYATYTVCCEALLCCPLCIRFWVGMACSGPCAQFFLATNPATTQSAAPLTPSNRTVFRRLRKAAPDAFFATNPPQAAESVGKKPMLSMAQEASRKREKTRQFTLGMG